MCFLSNLKPLQTVFYYTIEEMNRININVNKNRKLFKEKFYMYFIIKQLTNIEISADDNNDLSLNIRNKNYFESNGSYNNVKSEDNILVNNIVFDNKTEYKYKSRMTNNLTNKSFLLNSNEYSKIDHNSYLYSLSKQKHRIPNVYKTSSQVNNMYNLDTSVIKSKSEAKIFESNIYNKSSVVLDRFESSIDIKISNNSDKFKNYNRKDNNNNNNNNKSNNKTNYITSINLNKEQQQQQQQLKKRIDLNIKINNNNSNNSISEYINYFNNNNKTNIKENSFCAKNAFKNNSQNLNISNVDCINNSDRNTNNFLSNNTNIVINSNSKDFNFNNNNKMCKKKEVIFKNNKYKKTNNYSLNIDNNKAFNENSSFLNFKENNNLISTRSLFKEKNGKLDLSLINNKDLIFVFACEIENESNLITKLISYLHKQQIKNY